MGDLGACVVTTKATLPLSTSLAGIDSPPDTVTGAGLCPGTLHPPLGLQHSAVAFALAFRMTRTSP
jgi:hypothetical protein